MEHSYSKDFLPKDNVEVMATRTILIPKPPQCPSCHNHTSNEDLLAVSKKGIRIRRKEFHKKLLFSPEIGEPTKRRIL